VACHRRMHAGRGLAVRTGLLLSALAFLLLLAFAPPAHAAPPPKPTNLFTVPPSPSSNFTPAVGGTAEAGSIVTLFQTGDCSGIPTITTAAQFAMGVPQVVPRNAITRFTAKATNVMAESSPCSDPLQYNEDEIPPGAPSIFAPSSGTTTTPKFRGQAESATTVRIYKTADCSGSPAGSGPSSDFIGSAGIPVSVDANTSTTVRATATDGAGNISACSGPFTYTHGSSPQPPSGSSQSLRLSFVRARLAAGLLVFRARCSGPRGGRCAGRVVLRPVDPSDILDLGGAAYGAANFNIPSGATRVLRIRAARQLFAELRRDEEVLAQASARVAQPSGSSTTTTQLIAID
jgi:hypothetical protein